MSKWSEWVGSCGPGAKPAHGWLLPRERRPASHTCRRDSFGLRVCFPRRRTDYPKITFPIPPMEVADTKGLETNREIKMTKEPAWRWHVKQLERVA
jgi:hypothetical protein